MDTERHFEVLGATVLESQVLFRAVWIDMLGVILSLS